MLSDLVTQFDNTTIYQIIIILGIICQKKSFLVLIDEKYEGIKLSTNELSTY